MPADRTKAGSCLRARCLQPDCFRAGRHYLPHQLRRIGQHDIVQIVIGGQRNAFHVRAAAIRAAMGAVRSIAQRFFAQEFVTVARGTSLVKSIGSCDPVGTIGVCVGGVRQLSSPATRNGTVTVFPARRMGCWAVGAIGWRVFHGHRAVFTATQILFGRGDQLRNCKSVQEGDDLNSHSQIRFDAVAKLHGHQGIESQVVDGLLYIELRRIDSQDSSDATAQIVFDQLLSFSQRCRQDGISHGPGAVTAAVAFVAHGGVG